MIAATALEHDLVLVTHNTKDFDDVPDLVLRGIGSCSLPGGRTLILQHVFTEQIVPKNGYVTVSDRPGMGMELDPAVIERERYLSFEVS